MTTKDNENLQQQQILFSESDSVTEQGKASSKTGRLVLLSPNKLFLITIPTCLCRLMKMDSMK